MRASQPDPTADRLAALERENLVLRQELDRTRTVLEEAALAYQSLDAQGRLRRVSRGWLELLGWEREHVLGRPFEAFVDPADHAALRGNFRQMQRTGRTSGFECMALRKNGGRVNVSIEGLAEIEADGSLRRTHCILRDITREKAAKAVLEQREQFYRAAFDSAGIPIAIVRSLRLLYANPCMAAALGADGPAALIGRSPLEFVAPHHAEEFLERARRRELGLDATSQYEVDVVHADGHIIPVQATTSTLLLPDGPATIGFFHDISNQRRIAASLRQSEIRFRTLFDEVPAIAVQGYDQNRTVIYWNGASERLYGYSAAEALGRRLEDLIIPEAMRDQVIADIRAWIEDGVPIPSGEMRLVRKDGSPVPVFSSHVMQKAGDSRHELYCLDVDLSELHAAKDELTRARDAAQAANQAKSEFLANMSHEIRTPMNGVLGMLQLLMGSELKGEQMEYVELAFQSSRRLLDLLNDILDFSRIESGKLSLVQAPFSPRVLAESVLRVFEPNARKRGLALGLRVDHSAEEPLLGDEARLRQILFNLVGNAVKFTQAGEVRLEVWTRPEPGASAGLRRLYLSVSDTGEGIPEDKIPLVFERFTQTDGSFTRQHEGAGLGLAIVKRIVDLMGGHIVVDSEPKGGTTVGLHLPLPLAQPSEAEAPPPVTAADHGRPLRILVAEDDRISQMYMEQQLRRLGHESRIVSNGAEAVSALRKEDFDCVLMDVQMPVLDGVEATRAIREDDRTLGREPTHIVAMTAYALSGDREKFLDAGMDDYVSKPVRSGDLARALDHARDVAAVKAARA